MQVHTDKQVQHASGDRLQGSACDNGEGVNKETGNGDYFILDRSSFNQGLWSVTMSYQKTTGPLMANSHPGSYSGRDAYNDMFVTARAAQRERERESMDVRNAEIGQLHDEQQGVNDECEAVQIGNGSDCEEEIYECRRLTPAECGRLQGFPDGWCDDVPHTDSAEYKLWGNGIALPCLLPMFKAMKKILEEGR